MWSRRGQPTGMEARTREPWQFNSNCNIPPKVRGRPQARFRARWCTGLSEHSLCTRGTGQKAGRSFQLRLQQYAGWLNRHSPKYKQPSPTGSAVQSSYMPVNISFSFENQPKNALSLASEKLVAHWCMNIYARQSSGKWCRADGVKRR